MKILLPCITAMALVGAVALASAGCGSKADNSAGSSPATAVAPAANAAPPGQDPSLASKMQQQGNGMSAAMGAAHQPTAPVAKTTQ